MNYIAHHGILGQKWGVRRYQNKDGSLTYAGKRRYKVGSDSGVSDIDSRKGIQRRLNDLDKAIARNRRSQSEAYEKSTRYTAKAIKAKTDEKHDLYNGKAYEYGTKYLEYSNNISAGKREIESLLSKAKNKSYTVSAIATKRNVNRGKDFIASLAASGALTVVGTGFIGAMALPGVAGVGVITAPHHSIQGTKYKVKKAELPKKNNLGPLKPVLNYYSYYLSPKKLSSVRTDNKNTKHYYGPLQPVIDEFAYSMKPISLKSKKNK